MFHKRNPQGAFPGGEQEAPVNAQENNNNNSSFANRSAAVRPYVSAASQLGSQSNTTNQNTTNSTTTEGQNAMSNNNESNAPQTNTPNVAPSANIPGTMPYGRPAAPAMGGVYGGASNPYANPYGSGRKLIIGEGITMSGEIEHCDHLIVEGTVQATLKDAKLLDISEAGVFYGTVDIEEATIAGRFEGDIIVAGRLTVKSSGVITGSITYKELAIEAGATIEGTLSPAGARKGEDNIAAADFSKGKALAKGKPGEPLFENKSNNNNNSTNTPAAAAQ